MAMKREERLRQYLEKSTPSCKMMFYYCVWLTYGWLYWCEGSCMLLEIIIMASTKETEWKDRISNNCTLWFVVIIDFRMMKPGILDDSHCLHCLFSFKASNIECQYYLGYLGID